MADSHASRSCPGPLDRRAWLKVGGLSLGALVTGMNPNLAALCAAEAGPRRPALSKDFSVILFWANGGPSHLDTFDLKPDAPAEIRLRPQTGRTSNWDDHSVNSHIFQTYGEKLPYLDQAVSALVENLHQRGLDGHVLFIFCREFGRTPRIAYQDASRRPGRDHWPRAMSVFLSSGGLKMGQAVAATNARGEEPSRRGMDSNCLLATIYHRFGIDVNHDYHDRSGRPIPILREGEPIAELL